MKLRISVFVLLVLGAKLEAQVNQNGDFQIWNYDSIEGKTGSVFGTRLTVEERWGDNASRLYFVYGQLQVVYAKRWLEIAPGYRQEYFRSAQKWQPSYTPMADITFFSTSPWQVADRSRIMYQIPQDASVPSAWIYRNRLRLTSPALSSFLKPQFFIDEEAFFREREGFYQNRVSIGLFSTFTSFLQGRIFYIYRNLKQTSGWTYQNVLALHLYFSF